MQMVHRKYRNHASHTTLLLLLFASNGNVLAQTCWIAKNLRAGCALMTQGVLTLLFGSDSPAAADPQMAITIDATLYGRDIPYVPLMHIGAFDAEMLPRLLALYRSRGFQFITLQEAERDPFYVRYTDLNLPPGANTLERAMAERQMPLPKHPVPAVQLNSLCR